MSGSIGLSGIQLYVAYSANESSRAQAALKANPEATALAAYFQKQAPSIASPLDLLKNYKVLSVVLGAFGLGDKINDTAILKQLLTQNPASTNSLAYQLGDAKYQLFANAFAKSSGPPFATASSITQIVNSYATNLFEQQANTQSPGLGNALQFTREAASLKSVAAIQTDPNLLAVTVTGLGLPLQNFQELDFDQQTSILTQKLKLADLQKPSYVKQAAEQYLVQQQSAGASAPPPGSVASLFSDSSDTTGDSLLSILNPSASSNDSSTASDTLSLFA
jgi:hypothetical protein